MAPGRSSTRRGTHTSQLPPSLPNTDQHQDNDPNVVNELFIDPMLGAPLAMYVEKDVVDKDAITDLITKHGGTVSPGYSGVTYILVDPHKPSGQNLYRQYAGKKGKIILDARWVRECVDQNRLHTYSSNWAGCKVTGNESIFQAPPPRAQEEAQNRQIHAIHPQALQTNIPPVDPLQSYSFQVYPPPMHGAQRSMDGSQPQPWQVTISPAQAHIHAPPAPPPSAAQAQAQPYRDESWEGYNPPADMTQHTTPYDYRYRDDQSGWVSNPGPYYEPTYDGYPPPPAYIPGPTDQPADTHTVPTQTPHIPQNATASSSDTPPAPAEPAEKPRGRKRTRTQATPATPATALVVNRNPPARSPTPPTRVIKSTYGGNLFTADDVLYLKRYIDYCQDQCMVLSLREICERIAIKAPHHTFYSWRRYCNKHQIRLGGYAMNHDRSESPSMGGEDMDIEIEGEAPDPYRAARAPPGTSTRLNMNVPSSSTPRNRSPTPPRALFRSTTGKGVAFTQEDVNFLMKFMEYRKSQGTLDMVAFWKDVATKAPHHSRASWMKFWRRHKHELERNEGDAPLPAPPDKKMRYSKEDDVLLAKYFFNKPGGTSDRIFQDFGRAHPHHPWKGWQEHHRIHKAKIEHLMEQLGLGENIDDQDMDES